MGELRAYAAMFGGTLRSVVSYRASFAVDTVGNVFATGIDILTVFVLFSSAKLVAGFTLSEALLLVGLTQAGFVLADLTVGNIDQLKTYVRSGRLDAVLVRPLGVLPQLIFMDLPVRKVLRLVLGLVVLGVAVARNDVQWTTGTVFLLVAAPLAGAVFFGSIFVMSAAVAFWWVESGELGNAITYGGRDFASYPVTIFDGWFRNLFAYGLGFAFITYHPALALLGRDDPLGLPGWTGYLSPLVALLAATIAAVVWRTGVRHYRSTGS